MDDDDEYDGGESRVTLDELRAEIAEIDRDIVDLIARRTYVAQSIAEVKASEDMEITDAEQERRVMDRARRIADRYDLDEDLIADVFTVLIELNKVEQRDAR